MKLKLYLTISYVKYIVLMLIAFLLIIWLAQIIRYMELGQSLAIQLSHVTMITSYLLPNAISTILPIIIFIASCFLNKHINQTNELSIISMYLSTKNMNKIILLIYGFILVIHIFNTEVISVNAYNKYKFKEIEFRNQFKIKNNKNEIYIKDKINLFYEKKNQENSILEKVTTYLIEENIVIVSEQVKFNQSEEEILFTFIKGQRISSSNTEKSFTNFDKLEYKIYNNSNDKISFDKDNYNFIQLLKNDNPLYKKAAHRKLIDLLFLILILTISRKLIFINEKSEKLIANYTFNLFMILTCFTILAFITKLFISDVLTVIMFYMGSVTITLITGILLRRIYAFL